VSRLQRLPGPGHGCIETSREVDEDRLLRQVVEQRVGGIKEKRQVELDAGGGDAVAHAAVDCAAGRVALEAGTVAPAEGADRIAIERHLARGEQTHRGERVERALALRVETADRLDFVVEEIDAQRRVGTHRIDVEQRAAHRVLAGAGNLAHARVARLGKPQPKGLECQPLADAERKTAAGHVLPGSEALQQGVDGDQDQTAAHRGQFGERQQAFAGDVRMRREHVVRQHLAIGQGEDAQALRREETEFGATTLEAAAVGLDHQPRARVGDGRFGEGKRRGAAMQPGPAHLRAPGIGE
jgi:hypothetical protein